MKTNPTSTTSPAATLKFDVPEDQWGRDLSAEVTPELGGSSAGVEDFYYFTLRRMEELLFTPDVGGNRRIRDLMLECQERMLLIAKTSKQFRGLAATESPGVFRIVFQSPDMEGAIGQLVDPPDDVQVDVGEDREVLGTDLVARDADEPREGGFCHAVKVKAAV